MMLDPILIDTKLSFMDRRDMRNNDVLSGDLIFPVRRRPISQSGEYSEGGQLLNGGLTCSLGEAFGVKSSRMVSNSL